MDKLVDFSQPIESVHRLGIIGKVEPHCLSAVEGSAYAGKAGVGQVDACYGNWRADGSPCNPANPWTIRNTAKPSTPSNEELTQRMGEEAIDLLCKLAKEQAGGDVWDRSRLFAQWVERAQMFVSDLPKPVDPIETRVTEIMRDHEIAPDDTGVRAAIRFALAAGGTAHERN